MQTSEYILMAITGGQFLTMIIGGYLFLRKPSDEAKKKADDASDDIGAMQIACTLKHLRIDEVLLEFRATVKTINDSLLLLKENDIKHIEQEMRHMSEIQVKILTILEYSSLTNSPKSDLTS